MSLIAGFSLAASLSVALVAGVRWHALRRGLLDVPNERSSHTSSTPRGGGLGYVVAFLATVAVLIGPTSRTSVAIAALSVLLVAGIGWVDDHGGASVRLRLVIHLIAGALLVPLVHEVPLPLLLAPLGAAWWIFWTISAINVVNFMDGIDGIIGLQVLLFGAYVAVLGAPDGPARAAGVALAGASLGFLVWNWSPARIFMGDVGSGALGVIVVAAGALLVREGQVDFVATFAPLVPIFLDAAITMLARVRRGERLSQAHRGHLYQRLANGGVGHARVSLGYGAASVACALVAAAVPQGGLFLLGALLLGGVLVATLVERRVIASFGQGHR